MNPLRYTEKPTLEAWHSQIMATDIFIVSDQQMFKNIRDMSKSQAIVAEEWNCCSHFGQFPKLRNLKEKKFWSKLLDQA